MEALEQIFAVLFVLALLAGTVYGFRRRGMAQFALPRIGGPAHRRMQSLERLALTPQHSLHLVRVDGRVLLIAVAPGVCSVLDGNGTELPGGEKAP